MTLSDKVSASGGGYDIELCQNRGNSEGVLTKNNLKTNMENSQ